MTLRKRVENYLQQGKTIPITAEMVEYLNNNSEQLLKLLDRAMQGLEYYASNKHWRELSPYSLEKFEIIDEGEVAQEILTELKQALDGDSK